MSMHGVLLIGRDGKQNFELEKLVNHIELFTISIAFINQFRQ